MHVLRHIRSFESEDPQVRKEAIEKAASSGQKAVRPLLKALKHPLAHVRASAAKALGRMRAAEAMEALADALINDEVVVKCPSVIALGKLRDYRAAAPLSQALMDESRLVRSFAFTNIRGLIRACTTTGEIDDLKVHLRHVVEIAQGKNVQEARMAASSLIKKADSRLYAIMASEKPVPIQES